MDMKKITSVAAAFAMTASLLAGCGGDTNETTAPAVTKAPVETQAVTKATETTAATESEDLFDYSLFEGWWVLSPNYYEGVIPIISTFYVDSENEVWYCYNDLGEETGPFDCYIFDDGTITLDIEGLGEQELMLDDGVLYYTDDGHEAYIQTDDPGFIELSDETGDWFFVYDSDITYNLSGDTATKYDGDSEVLSAPYEHSVMSIQSSTGSMDSIPFLELEWPNPQIFPSADGQYLIEKDTFRNNLYVRGDTEMSEEMMELLDYLLNSTFYEIGDSAEEQYLRLSFDPMSTFRVITMVREGDYYTQDTSAEEISGKWTLEDDLWLTLEYKDGGREELDMSMFDGEVLDSDVLDTSFALDSFNAYDD